MYVYGSDPIGNTLVSSPFEARFPAQNQVLGHHATGETRKYACYDP